MRIILVSPYAFGKEPGGVKEFILGLKSRLVRKGHNVWVVAPGSKDAQKNGLVDFVLGRPFGLSTDQTKLTGSFSRKKTAREILEKVKPDIIVIHEPLVPTIGHTIISTVLKREVKSRPVIVGQFHARRDGLGFRIKAIEFIGKHIIRRPQLRRGFAFSPGYISTIMNGLDARIAVSQAVKEFWQKKYPGDYKVIYNGINTKELVPGCQANPPRGWNKRTPLGLGRVILFAGRHDERKGIGDLINAFNLLVHSGNQDLRLKITGEGEMTGKLKELVKELGLETLVEFVGVLSRAELIKTYRTSDLLVAPSIDGEGFNRTIAEARACGTLVVCTDIEGQREAIGKELSAFMAIPQSPQNLAKQIKAVLDLPESKKQEIRKLGREEVKSRFDWETIAREHINFYESLL